jgi:hypothetical protein
MLTAWVVGVALEALVPVFAVDFIQIARVFPENSVATGSSVAVFGDAAVVCSERTSQGPYPLAGACWVYTLDVNGDWQVFQWLYPTVATYGGRFGTSVAMSADRIVIGADAGCCPQATDSGRVFVYRKSGTFWTQEAMLTPTPADDDDFFGAAVAIDGTSIVVGAPGDDDAAADAGAVYLFHFAGSTWSLEKKLIPPNNSPAQQRLGTSVGIAGNEVVGGGSDAAVRIYRIQGSQWQEKQALLSPGTGSTMFGASLAFDGTWLVVGAPAANATAVSSGALYAYQKQGTTWTLVQTLAPSDQGGRLGSSLALSGSTLIAGADARSVPDAAVGAAYVFRENAAVWAESQILTGTPSLAGARFGSAVAFDGTTAFAGAPEAGGMAYVFDQRVLHPPVADAGVGGTVECDDPGGGQVFLDGSGSTDPDSTPGTNDDIVGFEWFDGAQAIGLGSYIPATLLPGTHTVTLRVTDFFGATSVNSIIWTVVNNVPPILNVSLSGAPWPPNHRMVKVTAVVTPVGACGSSPITLESVISSEPDDDPGGADGSTADDIQDATTGALDREFQLRAERSSSGAGRTYTATYRLTEAAGGGAVGTATIFVPMTVGGITDPIQLTLAKTPAGTRVDWTPAPGAVVYNVVQGRLSEIKTESWRYFLGIVHCIESRSIDTTTAGHEQSELPEVGDGFFYLVEYDDGARTGYGEESAAKPRIPLDGDCP